MANDIFAVIRYFRYYPPALTRPRQSMSARADLARIRRNTIHSEHEFIDGRSYPP
jgi:hypothetical protein